MPRKIGNSWSRYLLLIIESGAQPLVSTDGNLILTVNGEIYNYLSLKKQLKGKYEFKTESDCEVILYLVSSIDKVG